MNSERQVLNADEAWARATGGEAHSPTGPRFVYVNHRGARGAASPTNLR